MYTLKEIRQARKEDASVVAGLIMEAMCEECCRYYYGEGHTAAEFHDMMSRLVEREDSQYSYRNTLCAVAADGRVAGICVSYDGGQLLRLRRAFIDEVKARFGRDFSDMPEETQAGEIYLDSMAVVSELRGQGIAHQLFRAAEERARQAGIGTVGLLVDRGNPGAERLYRQLGYEQVDDKEWGGHLLKHLQKKVDGRPSAD